MPEQTKTDFDPAATSALYDQYKPGWELNLDFYEMAEHVLRNGLYLDRFGEGSDKAESTTSYNWRMKALFAMDVCADIVTIRVDNLFRTEPIRSFEDSPYAKDIEGFINDVDGSGTHMNEFMRRAVTLQYINGVDIIVGKTASDKTYANLAQEIQDGARSYLMARGPLERPGWSCDHSGQYKWVRYDLGDIPAESEGAESAGRQYLTLTESGWTLYTTNDDKKADSTAVSGDSMLGVVPVVPFYWGDSVKADNTKIPISLLTRPAPVARAMLNLVSQGQLDLYMAIGILAAMGANSDECPTEVSPNCWIAFSDPTASVQRIAPAVQHISEKRDWLNAMTQTILRMGKMSGASVDLEARATSGVQVSVERTDLDNEMSATADQAARVEEDSMRMLVSRQKGVPLISAKDFKYSVNYNKRYVLAGVDELLKDIDDARKGSIHIDAPTMMRALLSRAKTAIVRPDDPRAEDIDEEIKKATFESEFSVPDLSGGDE